MAPRDSEFEKILDEIDSLREEVRRLAPSSAEKEASREGTPTELRRVSPDILERKLGKLREDVSSMLPRLQLPSPLGDLSTRVATHFFNQRSLGPFSEKVLDELIAETGAGSGALLLFRPPHSEAEVIASRNNEKENMQEEPRVSRTVVSRIAQGHSSVLVQDAIEDDALGQEDSVQQLHLRSVLAIPLRFQDYLAGAIYLENQHKRAKFDVQDRDLLRAIGSLVAIFLNATLRLDKEIEARQRIYNELKGKTYFDGLVGNSVKMIELVQKVEQVGPTDATIFIQGENGTGKELFARAIHQASKRASGPMVVVNCAAIPDNLLESELFGTEKGAFTDAVSKAGSCEEAHGGTLFLDEIGELSIPFQAKLLRFLQERSFRRVGGRKNTEVDVRVVAATNRDIKAMVKTGGFREDLFFRLWVIPIQIPPLRERPEDIPELVEHFSKVFALQNGKEPPEFEPEVLGCMLRHTWPGNIRELEHVVQRIVILNNGEPVTVYDLPDEMRPTPRTVLKIKEHDPFRDLMADVPKDYDALKRRRQEFLDLANAYARRLEQKFVDYALSQTENNISRAAEKFGMHRTLIHKILRAKKEGEDPEE